MPITLAWYDRLLPYAPYGTALYPHFAARKCQRHQRLAICRFAKSRCILSRDTNRALALLRHRGVIDNQHRILAADKPVGLIEQFRFQRCRVPDTIGDEMVQLIVVARCKRSAIC